MKYSHIIFDLDGTLVNSASEIHESAMAISQAYGLRIPSLEYIRTMTGSPPGLFFLDHGCKEAIVDQLVAEFRSHLASNAGNPECIFPDAKPLLELLNKRRIPVSLSTTKPTNLATTLLLRYGLDRYFTHIQGTDPPHRHKPHPDILNACMELSPSLKTVMVGDTIFDVEAAHNANIDSIAVCMGAHTKDQLATSKPTYLLETLGQLNTLLELNE